MKRNVLFSVFLLLSGAVLAQNGSFSGAVTDSRTGEPLIGATLLLEGTNLGTTTDVSGNYTFKDVPPRSYNLRVSFVGYITQTVFDIVIRSEGNIDINIQLVESSEQLQDVVVTASPFPKIEETPLSIQKLSQQEVAAYPGGNNDIAKVVQSLPGISGSQGGFRNDVIIRGGSPSENVYYLDGIEIPNINHFSTQGSAGGPVGLLNVSFFEGVTLSSSAFGAQYDNVLSGVLQFDQRRGNDRHFTGNFRLGASESALTLEGPLFKRGKEKSNTSYIVSVRRSYLQFLFKVLGLPILPDYWDYQYKISHKIDDRNELIFTGVGSIDDYQVNELEEFDAAQQAVQDQVPIIRQRTNTFGASWKRRFKDNSGFMTTTVSHNQLKNNFAQYTDNINETGAYFVNDSREAETRLRYSLTKFLGSWTATAGGTLQFADYANNTLNLVNGYAYNTELGFARYGIFGQASSRVFNDRLSVSFGFRMDGNTFTEQGNQLYRTFSPRASFSWQLDKSGKWNFNTSIGRYFKLPAYTILGFQENGVYVNQAARYLQSDHAVAGFERLLSSSARLSLEGFYKKYRYYPVSIADQVSLANKGGGFEVLGNEPVLFNGKGRTYGLELLYQQKFTGKLYVIAALTLYRSEFSNGSDDYVASAWDNRSLISITGGYKFGRNWEVSGRYRFFGGAPYAPVNEAATLAAYPAVIKDYSRLGEERLGAFQQLDIRVDKKWSFRKFSLDLFLDIQNITAAVLPAEPSYGLNRDAQGNVIDPRSLVVVDTNATGTVLPSLGIVVNF